MLENDLAKLNLSIMHLFFMVKSLANWEFQDALAKHEASENPEVGLLLLAGLDVLRVPGPVSTQTLQHFST